MTRRHKLLAGIGAVALGAAGAVVGVWRLARSWDDGLCGNQILSESLSPNRKWKVVVFERDCGATTNFSTQASILDAKRDLPPAGGNIFVADYALGSPHPGPGGGPRASAQWTSDASVVITRDSARVFKQEPSHEGIIVSYVEHP